MSARAQREPPPAAPAGRVKKPAALEGLGSLLGGEMFGRATGTLRLLLFAPLLGPEGFGALRMAFTSSSILASFSGLGLHSAQLRYLPEAKTPGAARMFLRRALLWSLAGSALVAALVLARPESWASWIFSDARYSLMVLVIAFSLPVVNFYKTVTGAGKGLGRFRAAAIAESLQNLFYLLLGVAVILCIARSAELVFFTYLVAMSAGAFWLLRSRKGLRTAAVAVAADGAPAARAPEEQTAAEVSALFRRALRYSLWYSLIPLFQSLFDFVDRWALARFYDMETAGSYAFVPVLTGGMFIFGASMTPLVTQRGAILWQAAGARRASAERLVWSAITLVTLAGLAYAVALRVAAPVIWKVAGPRWAAAAPVVTLFLAYNLFFNTFYILGAFISFTERTWMHLVGLSAGAVANTALNLLLTPSRGMMGAAAATLAGIAVTLGCYVLFTARSRVAIPRRVWGILAAPLLALAPFWICVAGVAVMFLLSAKTQMILTDSDRRLLRVWVARRFGRHARKGAAAA